MGFQVLLIVLYMETFERRGLESATHPPRTHLSGKAYAQEFTGHLNNIDGDVKWMTEVIMHTESNEETNIFLLEQKEHGPLWIHCLSLMRMVPFRPKCTVRRPIQTGIYIRLILILLLSYCF